MIGWLRHVELVLLADLPDGVEHGRAAAAHQLHKAGVTGLAQRIDRLNGILNLDVDVEKDQVRRPLEAAFAQRAAVGEFDGVDTMVRTPTRSIFGCSIAPSVFSIRVQGTPRQPSSPASARPTGPPPTISTGIRALIV